MLKGCSKSHVYDLEQPFQQYTLRLDVMSSAQDNIN